jgi:hypothetical protein
MANKDRRTHIELANCPERIRAAQEAWASATARAALVEHRRRKRKWRLTLAASFVGVAIFWVAFLWAGSLVVEQWMEHALKERRELVP